MASILKEKLGDNLMFSVKKSSLEENNKIKDQILYNDGSIQKIQNIPNELILYFRLQENK